MPYKTFTSFSTLTAAEVNNYLMTQAIIRCTSTTRPSSPSEGWHIYETDTQRLLGYRNGQWVPYGVPSYRLSLVGEEKVYRGSASAPLVGGDLSVKVDPWKIYYFDSHIPWRCWGETQNDRGSAWVEVIIAMPPNAYGTFYHGAMWDDEERWHNVHSAWTESGLQGTNLRVWRGNSVEVMYAPTAVRRSGILRTRSDGGELTMYYMQKTNPDVKEVVTLPGAFLRVKELNIYNAL